MRNEKVRDCHICLQRSLNGSVAVMDWVLAQTLERKRRQLEAEEMEYAERLAQARKREAIMRRAAKARVRKRMVRLFSRVRSPT